MTIAFKMSLSIDEKTFKNSMDFALEQSQSLQTKVDELSQMVGSMSEKLDRITSFLSALSNKNIKPLKKCPISSTEEGSDDDRDSMLDSIDSTGEYPPLLLGNLTNR